MELRGLPCGDDTDAKRAAYTQEFEALLERLERVKVAAITRVENAQRDALQPQPKRTGPTLRSAVFGLVAVLWIGGGVLLITGLSMNDPRAPFRDADGGSHNNSTKHALTVVGAVMTLVSSLLLFSLYMSVCAMPAAAAANTAAALNNRPKCLHCVADTIKDSEIYAGAEGKTKFIRSLIALIKRDSFICNAHTVEALHLRTTEYEHCIGALPVPTSVTHKSLKDV